MKSLTTNLLRLFSKSILLSICLVSAATAQTFSAPPSEIVSAWKHDTENLVIVFKHDGSFYLVDGSNGNPGLERGNFTWNKDTLSFSADAIVDTNGEGGLSHPAGATSITVSGNTLTYTATEEGVFNFTRVINTASAIVGSACET